MPRIRSRSRSNSKPRSNYTGASTGRMVKMALFIAIIFVLTYTPLGFITIGPITATTIQMPVILGAIILGPVDGLILGLVFGLASFFKALSGVDVVATTIIAHNILLYIAIAIVPRTMMGWLTGLFYHVIKRFDGTKLISLVITGFVGSALNTVFYLGALYLGAADILAGVYDIDLGAVGPMVLGVAMAYGLPEAIASAIIVSAAAKAVMAYQRNR